MNGHNTQRSGFSLYSRPMTTLPAPIWRRFAAAFYDALLLLGVWLVALIIDLIMRTLLALPRDWVMLRAYLFLVGLAFFGWFWTHGGQTLGMRAWKLQVRRINGTPLRWLDAAARYGLTLLCWSALLAPALLRFPSLQNTHPLLPSVCIGAGIASLMALLMMRLDTQRRAPQDWLSRTEVVLLKAPKHPHAAPVAED